MNEIEIAGIKRDLRHLREVIVSVSGKGKDGADLRVAISFGLHTISTGCSSLLIVCSSRTTFPGSRQIEIASVKMV